MWLDADGDLGTGPIHAPNGNDLAVKLNHELTSRGNVIPLGCDAEYVQPVVGSLVMGGIRSPVDHLKGRQIKYSCKKNEDADA